jgi:hypothetical protein
MATGQFQFTTARLLQATTWLAVAVALLAYGLRRTKPAPIVGSLVLLGILAATGAAPGALAGKTITGAILGIIIGLVILVVTYAILTAGP